MPLPIVPAPMTPTVRTCITAPPSPLHRQSYCIAATQAQCRNPTLCVASIHLVEKRDQDAGAAGADRMSESNRAAVIDSRCIARGDGPVFFECRLQGAQRFDGGVGARRFIGIEEDGIAFALRNGNRSDFVAKLACANCRDSLAMAVERIFILTL